MQSSYLLPWKILASFQNFRQLLILPFFVELKTVIICRIKEEVGRQWAAAAIELAVGSRHTEFLRPFWRCCFISRSSKYCVVHFAFHSFSSSHRYPPPLKKSYTPPILDFLPINEGIILNVCVCLWWLNYQWVFRNIDSQGGRSRGRQINRHCLYRSLIPSDPSHERDSCCIHYLQPTLFIHLKLYYQTCAHPN